MRIDDGAMIKSITSPTPWFLPSLSNVAGRWKITTTGCTSTVES